MRKLSKYRVVFVVLVYLFVSCNNEKKEEGNGQARQEQLDVFTCPMHPEVIKNDVGTCPICGMDLVKKGLVSGAFTDLELEALLKPANEFVVATIPVTTIQQRKEDIALNVVGTVVYDTRRIGVVSSRVNGRVERLYIRYRYQPVRKGQRIMDIYSPDLVTAQQNLIFLLNNDPENTSLINATKARLLLMGMTAKQVAALSRSKSPEYSVPVFSNYSGFVTDVASAAGSSPADGMQLRPETNQELSIKEGMYVENGQSVVSVYDPSKAWVLLDIFPEQQILVKVGNEVRIIPETAPHQHFRARINYLEPVYRAGSKTLSARVYFNNRLMQLPIGSRVSASIFTSFKKASWLPKEAVHSLGRDKVVFIKGSGGFRAHKVNTGIEWNGSVQIVSGLSEMDSVASNAHFLVDNEAFIKVARK